MNHEKLEVYRQLMKTAEEVARRVTRWPRGSGYLSDQLRRAIGSAVLNLCEGNGKSAGCKDRRRFFRIAMGFLSEASACMDLAEVFGWIGSSDAARLKGEMRHAYFRIRRLP